MKLSRMRLRRLFESVLREEDNPGSKFASSVKKGDQNKSAADKQKATQELQKTYDWFVEVVFPAIENNKWPIVADDDYAFETSLFDDFYIGKGTSWSNIKEEQPLKKGPNPHASSARGSLGHVYYDLEQSVIKNNLRVTIQSDQPEEFEKAVEVAKKDPEEERVSEGLSRGSLYRRRYRRY